MDIAFLIVALAYASAFWTLSWRFPAVALALVFASAPFQNDLSGGLGGVRFSFAEVNLVLALPLFVAMLIVGARKMRPWPLLWTSLIYTSACIASSLVQWRGGVALSSFVQMGLFLFVVVPVFAFLGRRPDDLKPALWGMVGVAGFLAFVKVLQPSSEVFAINKNGMGGSLACALIVAVELWFHYRDKPSRHKHVLLALMGLIAVGLLLTLSRGGWIAAAAGIVLVAALRRQFLLLGRAGLVLVPLLAVAWAFVPAQSRDYATGFGSERGNIKQRYVNSDAALKQWQTNVWFGAGMGLRKELDATNFVVFSLGETGVFGLVSFCGMFAAFFFSLWHARARLPRSEFAFSLLAIGGGLMLSRLMQGMVDHYWARGPTMMAWASAGMATGALWFVPEGAGDRLQRARALLSLHLFESLRRNRSGAQELPSLSRTELDAAHQALAIVKGARRQQVRHTGRTAKEDDVLVELAKRLRENGN